MPMHFSSILNALARSHAGAADALLDLYEAVGQRAHPGRCVACYFKIMQRARNADPAIEALRHWLEAELEIVAESPEVGPLERLPVQLEGDDLESFCQHTIQAIREDRAYEHPQIELTFAYKAQPQAA